MPSLTVIIGSTRPGRAGEPIGRWFVERAKAHGGFDVHAVDLARVRLPFLDEPRHPRFHDYTHQHTRDWSETVAAADAFVLVTPEYNYGYTAPVKNAFDYLHHEWHYKPIGFVSYGGVAAGTRAVQQFKQVVTALKMFPLFEAVNIPFHTQFLEDGRFRPNDVLEDAARVMLDELSRVEGAMRSLRAEVLAG